MYAERTPPGTPPCETCRVVLREENEEVAAIYMLTRGQVVTINTYNDQGMLYSRAIDLSITAIKNAMDIYPGGIRDQWGCLQKVMKLFHHFRSRGNEGE